MYPHLSDDESEWLGLDRPETREGFIVSDEFIFVYGTLRKGVSTSMNRLLTRYCEYDSDGLIQGKLYEVKGYPGVVESNEPDDAVRGELHRIKSSSELLLLLDGYEECTAEHPQSHEYIRKKLMISKADGGYVSAWVYVYNRDISGLSKIESGDYLAYLEQGQNS